jgi:DNA-binding XRE family transcriptional regulator
VQLHNRIAVLRAERGLSRTALADALGVNYQTVGYIERGDFNPSLELAFRISEYFGLPIEAIFSRQPFRPLSEQVYGSRNSSRGDAAK